MPDQKKRETIGEVLHAMQKKINAPKNQVNTFGKYKYRSCEDILDAVKRVLPEGAAIIITDDIVEISGRVYVKATAKISNSEGEIYTTAFAREPETKKGMDDSQVTGATSSYARKYALNGLFAIDDTDDPDRTNEHGHGESEPAKKQERKQERNLNQEPKEESEDERAEILKWLRDCAKNVPEVYKEQLAKFGVSSARELAIEELNELKTNIKEVIN